MTFYHSTIVRTKKEHHCDGCQRVFPVGASLSKISSRDSDGFYSAYRCAICESYLKANRDIEDFFQGELLYEGWGPDADGGDFVADWLSKNKPLCVEYDGHWRKTKEGYDRKEGRVYELEAL